MDAFEAKNAAGKTEFAAISESVKTLREDFIALGKKFDVGFAAINAKLTMLTWIVGINTVAVFGAAMKIIFG